jgi:hypothetical protein
MVIPNNFFFPYEIRIDKKILDEILHVVYNSGMSRI